MRILAVDYGDARTGLAACDNTMTLATPLTVIHERNTERLIEQIIAAVKENDIGEIVVGNPVNMNGTKGERSQKCEAFADTLREKIGVPIFMFDERSTTVAAHALMNEADKRGKKRRDVIDAVAAAVILESYMNYRKNSIRT